MVYPEGLDMATWALTVLQDFPDDDVPAFYNIDEWRKWAETLASCPTFAQESIPDNRTYDNWMSWAKDLFLVMVNY